MGRRRSGDRITKTTVKAAIVTGRDYTIWDSDIAGFGVRVKPGGSRSYVFYYRNAAKRQKRMVLGDADSMRLEDARERAATLYGRVQSGEDVAEKERVAALERKVIALEIEAGSDAPNIVTFYDVAEAWAVAKWPTFAASTKSDTRRWLDKDIYPAIGSTPVADVTVTQVRKLINDIASTHPTKARRIGEIIQGVWLWGLDEEYEKEKFLIPPERRNPIRKIDLPRRNLVDNHVRPDDIVYVLNAIDAVQAEDDGDVLPRVCDIIRLALLTGARQGELRALRHDQVDLEKRTITLQRGEHKSSEQASGTGVKVIALPHAAVDIIKARQDEDDTYVFRGKTEGTCPARTYVHNVWNGHVLAKAQEDPKFKRTYKRVRFHDLRHTFATLALESGLSMPELQGALGHTDYRMTQRYAHHHADAKVAAVDRVAANLKK